MGQLEKYGLYVLCLVIFLILGVTIWGDPANANEGANGGAVTNHEAAAMRAKTAGAGLAGAGLGGATRVAQPVNFQPGNFQPGNSQPANSQPANSRAGGSGPSGVNESLSSLLRPGPRPPKAKPASPPSKVVPGGNAPVNNSNNKPVAKPPKTPVVTQKVTYTVRKGDTLGGIAQRQLGSARFVKSIEALNPGLNARKLGIGKKIFLPAKGAGNSGGMSTGAPSAYRTYTISKGDTFERVARVELGSAKRVKEILKLNPNVDPRRLALGKKIKLPLK